MGGSLNMRKLLLLFGSFIGGLLLANERWYEDNNREIAGGAPIDFIERIDRLTEWKDTRDTMQVFYIRHSTYKKYLKHNASLKQKMASIFNSYDIKVALDDNQAVWAHSDLLNIDRSFKQSIRTLQDLNNYGFDVAYVGLQSILSKPLRVDGKRHPYPMSSRYLDVSSYFEKIRSHFPDIKIGIIDALPAKVSELSYKSAYKGLVTHLRKKGYTLDFIHLDMPMSYPRKGKNGLSFPKLVDIGLYIKQSLKIPFGLFVVDNEGGAVGSNAFSKHAIDGLNEFLKHGGKADAYVLSSWYSYPRYSIPDRITQPTATGMSAFRNMDQLLNFYGMHNSKSCFYDVHRTHYKGNHDVMYPNYKPTGRLENIVFRASCYYSPDKKPLYNCTTDGSNTFVSVSACCEKHTPLSPSLIGYVYRSSGEGRKPIYRCRNGKNHLVTKNHTGCSKYGILGYTE
jgi:hypothetical protein